MLRLRLSSTTVLLALLFIPACSQSQTPDGPLVPVDWLSQRLEDDNLVLLHVGDADDYGAEHIPGAVLVSTADVSAPASRDRSEPALEMPEPEALRTELESLGVSDDSRIVVYFAGDFTAATRVLFTLRNFGFASRAQLLDGGLTAWKAAGNPVTDEPTAVEPGRLSPLTRGDLVVDAAYVNGHRTEQGVKVVDARASVFYDGTRRGGSRAGHIADAVTVPFSEITADDGHVKSVTELEAVFRAAGVQPGDTVITYCHIGQQATATLFGALLLGHPVRLYDGSYNQWSQDPNLPVVNPSDGG